MSKPTSATANQLIVAQNHLAVIRRQKQKTARQEFRASIAKKIPSQASGVLLTLYNALQNGTATTSQLEQFVAALSHAPLSSAPAKPTVFPKIAPKIVPVAVDRYAKDVKQAQAFAEKSNRQQNKNK